MAIAIDPTNIENEYWSGDYVEVGFTHPIYFPEGNSLYYPFNVEDIEELGNNVYRFYLPTGFEGWTDEIPFTQTGQVEFTGTVAHAPDIAWSQVCVEEGLPVRVLKISPRILKKAKLQQIYRHHKI